MATSRINSIWILNIFNDKFLVVPSEAQGTVSEESGSSRNKTKNARKTQSFEYCEATLFGETGNSFTAHYVNPRMHSLCK